MPIIIVGDGGFTNRQLIIELLKIKEVIICGQIPEQKDVSIQLEAKMIDDCNDLNKETQMKYQRPENIRYNYTYHHQRPKHKRYYL